MVDGNSVVLRQLPGEMVVLGGVPLQYPRLTQVADVVPVVEDGSLGLPSDGHGDLLGGAPQGEAHPVLAAEPQVVGRHGGQVLQDVLASLS